MFNSKAPKAPTKKTSHVLSIFQQTLNELAEVAKEHDSYAEQQLEIARTATSAAEEAKAEAAEARQNIDALNKALGR